MRQDRCRGAFTLVELIVVIGILTLVIALLLPALGRARVHANRVKCAANLRSLGQALILYTQQYGYYPGYKAALPDNSGDFAVWPQRLRPLLGGTQEVFYCPSQDQRCRWVRGAEVSARAATAAHTVFGYEVGEPILYNHLAYFSYGYNFAGAGSPGSKPGHVSRGLGWFVNGHLLFGADFTDRELRASRVRRPAEMIAIADSTADAHWDLAITPSPITGSPGDLHGGGANVLFCDGHVQWYARSELLRVSGPDYFSHMRRMWNADYGLSD